MLTAPATTAGWIGFILLWTLVAVGTRHLVGDAWTWLRWNRPVDRVRVQRIDRVPLHPSSPRFTRDDPSPKTRRVS